MLKAKALAASALAVLALAQTAGAGAAGVWQRYKDEFIQRDGRVIDYGQDSISHSEGQGYAMNFAVMFDDRDTFETVWRWTRDNIRVRPDGLFAWQWGRRADGEWTALDTNNATDGDMLIAHALLKADVRWPGAGYKTTALPIIRGLRKHLRASWHDRRFLLPGEKGFRKPDGFVVNPSYIIIPVMERFAEADRPSFWRRLSRDGRALLERCNFGPMGLPADWVLLSGSGVGIYDGREPEFGAAAVRVFLHAALEASPDFSPGARRMLDFYRERGYFPARVDLRDGALSDHPASAGSYAIYGLVADRLGEAALSARILSEAERKLAREERAYYSMSLYLLATGPRHHWN